MNNANRFLLLGLLSLVCLSGILLTSHTVSADDSAVDDVNIAVPISCSMSGVGQDSHNANIGNGIYQPDIGTTTIHAFCNDNEGFAIYAAGYTGNEIGAINSNKLVGTSSSGNSTIDTGLATSAGTPDVSNWAMKLTITQDSGDTTGTSVFTIDSDAEGPFSTYHTVPNGYTKVAHKTAVTDMNLSTGGVKLTTTYAAYISRTQPAGMYTGQVKYTLVHPHTAPEPVGRNQIGVIYEGNGLTFSNGSTINRVVYENLCTQDYGYVGNVATISKSPNIDDEGTQQGSYPVTTGQPTPVPITVSGASKMKVVLRYGFSEGTMMAIIKGRWDGGGEPDEYEMLQGPSTGSETYIFDGDAVTFFMIAQNAPIAMDGQDYGYFALIYPIYDEETAGTSYEVINSSCSYRPVKGDYAETTPWKGHWYMDGDETELSDAYDVEDFLNHHHDTLDGTNITIFAYNPYRILYDGNGATAGTMDGFYTDLGSNISEDVVSLLAPNYKKIGYGFAGWSENQNATVNNSDIIYGPNEDLSEDEIAFDSSRDITLYAIWVAPENGVTMQTFDKTAEPYASYDIGTVIALRDIRDDNVYAIAKFADGNWWMMENLRLDIATAVDGNGDTTINSLTTNSPTSNFVDTKVAAILDGTDDVYWKTCQTNSSACDNQVSFGTGNVNLNNPASPDASSQDYSWYSYGVFYNYYTATAGNGLYLDAALNDGDICPKNWRIPYSYSALMADSLGLINDTIEAGQRIREYPYNYIYAGRYYGTFAQGRNSFTSYMSTENAPVTGVAPVLSIKRADGAKWVNIGTAKWNGYPVRCFAFGQN